MDRPFIPSVARAALSAAIALVLAAGLAWASLRLDPQECRRTAKVDKAAAGAAAKAKAKKSVVPFEMLPTNHMLVEAKINGKGPYRLIFDLGAPITLLSNRASEAVGRGEGRRPALVPVRDAGRGRDRRSSRRAGSRPPSCR